MAKMTLRQLQTQLASTTSTWRAGATSVSGLSEAEQARRLGLSVKEEEMRRVQARLGAARPPSAFSFSPARDWRNKDGVNWTTPIRDQGNCGSCVAFATVATIEAKTRIQERKADWPLDLSEADLFFCGAGKKCNEGWWPPDALDYAKTKGVSDETCFPYQDHDIDCQTCADRPDRLLQVTEYEEVVEPNARKEFIDKTGPMVACMAVYQDFFYYKDGVYKHPRGADFTFRANVVEGRKVPDHVQYRLYFTDRGARSQMWNFPDRDYMSKIGQRQY